MHMLRLLCVIHKALDAGIYAEEKFTAMCQFDVPYTLTGYLVVKL